MPQASPDPCSHRCETWWEKWLSCAYSPFFFHGDRQGLLPAVVKTEAATELLQWWHQGYNVLWFCLSCIFSFCGREVIHYEAKHVHHERNTKSTETAPFSSKSWSRQQRIITWYLFGRPANNLCVFLEGDRLLPNSSHWTPSWSAMIKYVRPDLLNGSLAFEPRPKAAVPCTGFKMLVINDL